MEPLLYVLLTLLKLMSILGGGGCRHSVAVKCLHCNGKDVGLNLPATRNEYGHWEGPLHRRCPNGPTGSKWKTSDVKAELDL